MGEAFLGPVLPPWDISFTDDGKGLECATFKNTENGNESFMDPRLGLVPAPWRWQHPVRTPNDPWTFVHFRNEETGEMVNYDPRMLPEALKTRGVHVETFLLV